MQTELLFELTYILLEKKIVTASEMAIHFGVSQRTIYRWVDALNLAGVPVITTKGKGGGIQLAEKYTLDKAVLTEDEKLEILSSVQAFEVLSGNSNSAVSKLKAITKANADWIKIDFAPWNPKASEIRDLFNLLKYAIINKRQISFDYYSGKGEATKRTADPWKIIFKGQAWYLYSYCNTKNEPRYFKLNRMCNCIVLVDKISKEENEFPENEQQNSSEYEGYTEDKFGFIDLKLKVTDACMFRILDEFKVDKISDCEDQKFKIIELKFPNMDWILHWILSYGSHVKVLEPENLAQKVKQELQKMLQEN